MNYFKRIKEIEKAIDGAKDKEQLEKLNLLLYTLETTIENMAKYVHNSGDYDNKISKLITASTLQYSGGELLKYIAATHKLKDLEDAKALYNSLSEDEKTDFLRGYVRYNAEKNKNDTDGISRVKRNTNI